MRRLWDYASIRPLVLLAPFLIAGIAISGRVEAGESFAILVAAGVCAAAAPMILWRRARAAGLALAGLFFGFARHELAERRPAGDVGRAAIPEDRVRVRGRVAERPRLFVDRRSALEEVEERHDDRAAGTFPLDLIWVEGMAGVAGRVQVKYYDRRVDLRGGEELELTGKLRHPRPRTNPGGFDREAWLRRQGIGAVMTVGAKDEWRLVRPAPIMSLRGTIDDARYGLRSTLRNHAEPRTAAMMAALLIGSREQLPQEVVTGLQRSGTAHFLAVSGQNLAIVLMLVAGFLTLAGFRGPRQHATVMVVLLAYTALSGWEVSVVRAFLMAAIWLGAHIVWRKSDSVNALAAAVVAIAATDPGQVFQAGFQLSFLAVAGILWIAPVFHDFLSPGPGPDPGRFHLPLRWGRATLAVSMAAWLATAPVILHVFNMVTPVILVSNLVLVPLMLGETAAGIALLACAPIAPPAADLFGWIAGLIVSAIAGISALLARAPGSHFYAPAMPAWLLGAYYGALAGWTAWARLSPASWKPWLCALFGLVLGVTSLQRERPAGFHVAMLDVGRGSALYAEWPDGRNVVVDCGSLDHRDAGASVVAPYLWSRGVRHVDLLVLSHPDADHVNGVEGLMERVRVRRVAITRHFPPEFAGLLASRCAEVITVERAGLEPLRLADGVEVLGPPTWEKFGPGVPANETSIVLRLDGRVLIPGDVEERGVEELLQLGQTLRSEVLVVPHHGKRQDLHRELVSAVAPSIALVSAPEGYSSTEVVDHLAASVRVFQTGRDGCIELVWKDGDVSVSDFRAR